MRSERCWASSKATRSLLGRRSNILRTRRKRLDRYTVAGGQLSSRRPARVGPSNNPARKFPPKLLKEQRQGISIDRLGGSPARCPSLAVLLVTHRPLPLGGSLTSPSVPWVVTSSAKL